MSSGTPNYSYSYDTAKIEAISPMEAGSLEFAGRYSQEPGLYDAAFQRDVAVFDWSSGPRDVVFALGARPDSDRSVLAYDRCRGMPASMSQPIETSVDDSARIDRETSIGPGAENPDIYRERVDRSRYFSRDDVRDDNLDVDPTFGRGATVRDRSQFDVDVQSRRDAQIYRNTSTGVRSRDTNAGVRVRSMTSEPGFDTTRDTTSGAGSGMGSGGVSSREYPTSTEAGDVGADTSAGGSAQPGTSATSGGAQVGTGTTATGAQTGAGAGAQVGTGTTGVQAGTGTTGAGVQAGTGPSGEGATIGAGPSGTTVRENTGTPGSGTAGSGTSGANTSTSGGESGTGPGSR